MQKFIFQIGLKRFLLLKKVENTVPWKYFNIDLNGKEIVGKFYVKELQTKIKSKLNKEFRVEKVINWKGDKLYVKWKGYGSYFNSWIDKKDIVI